MFVSDVENATGSSRYRPLAAATNGLIILNAERPSGVRVLRGAKTESVENPLTLSTRPILWKDRPTAMMSAHDVAGVLVWASMTSGDEALSPLEVSAAIEDFGKSVRPLPSD